MSVVCCSSYHHRLYFMFMTCLVVTTQLMMNRFYRLSTTSSTYSSSSSSSSSLPRCDDVLFMTTVTTARFSNANDKDKDDATTRTSASRRRRHHDPHNNNNNNNDDDHHPFCSTHILGEKQSWNHYKKIISYAIFAPTSIISSPRNGTRDNGLDTSTTTTTRPDEWVLHGMERNMLDAQLYYPDWIVRIHTFDVPQDIQDKWLIHNATMFHNVELVTCHSSSPKTSAMTLSNSRKMLSRLLPYDDPKVWYTLVRDADSRLSLREVMAVHEFLQTSISTDNRQDSSSSTSPLSSSSSSPSSFHPKSIYFHSMRDHEEHQVPIMGGMFGMKRGLLRVLPFQLNTTTTTPTTTTTRIKKSRLPMETSSTSSTATTSSSATNITTMTQLLQHAFTVRPFDLGGCCGEDQQFLTDFLWPHISSLTLVHDSDPRRCHDHGAKLCWDFPLGPRDESNNYYVGSAFKQQPEQQPEQQPQQQNAATTRIPKRAWRSKNASTTTWQPIRLQHACTLQCILTNETSIWDYYDEEEEL